MTQAVALPTAQATTTITPILTGHPIGQRSCGEVPHGVGGL